MSGLAIASSLLTAFLLAALALRVLMMRPPPHRSNGVWRIDLSLGGEHAGLYLKAFTAWHSLFALAAALGLAQSQRPEIGPPPHSGVAADVQLPDG